jgi:hypothetical protein
LQANESGFEGAGMKMNQANELRRRKGRKRRREAEKQEA